MRHSHKFILLLAAILLSVAGEAQSFNKVDKFLKSYEAFVDEVVATPLRDFHGDTLNHVKRQQKSFMRRYRWYFDNRMSVEQLEYYNKLCGRYHRKMRQVANRRRLAAARGRLEGRFEGLFNRDSVVDTI